MKDKFIKETEEEKEEENFNDMYDIAKAVTKVKTKHATLNEDFTIANLKPEILENNLIIYIKENINIMVAVTNYLSIETKKKIWNEKTRKYEEITIYWDKKYLEQTKELTPEEIEKQRLKDKAIGIYLQNLFYATGTIAFFLYILKIMLGG